jgi:RNA polymerase sigma factor (sigma-70 family)
VHGNYHAVPTEIERLYREHRAGLVQLVERELHDHHDAEDVVQTAFLDAQRALERGTTPRHPRAWLAAIAINAGRRLRRRRVIAEPLEEYAVQGASEVPEIRAALASLPREQREAVVYRDLLGLSYDETAEEMGKSVNAVTMLLHRGRKGLRQTLGVTTGGIWLWRWLRRAGMPQVAVAKGAAAVVVAGGLATTGVVAAQVIAPAGAETAAAAPATPILGGLTMGAEPAPGGVLMLESGSRRFRTEGDSIVTAVTPGLRTDDATPASTNLPTTANSSSPQTVGVPTVSAPAVPPIPTSPPTIAATVTTPVTTVAVTTPTGTTATVTTPITTVTVPIP